MKNHKPTTPDATYRGFRNATLYEIRELAKRLRSLANTVNTSAGQAFTEEEVVKLYAHLKGTGDMLFNVGVGPDELATEAEEDEGILMLHNELDGTSPVVVNSLPKTPDNPHEFPL